MKKRASSGLRSWLALLGWFCGVWVYTELCLHLLVFGMPAKRILFPVLFGVGAGALATLICQWMPLRLQRWAAAVLTALPVIFAEVQYVYQAIFGGLMPLSQVVLGGNVLDFRSQLFYAIGKNWVQVLLLLLPLPIWLLLLILKKSPCRTLRGWWLPASLGALAASVGLALGLMYLTREPAASVYRQFYGLNTSTTASYRSVGMAGTLAQELRLMVFPREEASTLAHPALGQDPDPDLPRNQLDINFPALIRSTDDEALQNLDRFFSGSLASPKNEYTGRLAGFNVITICAESFSPWLISEELTPTLYRLSKGGFVFENYYGCFQSVTTNGEYATCLGLLPDLSRSKTASSFDASVGHYLPFTLGNALKQQGYDTWAYHNYIGEFYNRTQTHANMGYTFKSASSGLDITLQWPASDLELMEASVGDYIDSDKPFHAYYMTFSGHYQYNWHNAMSMKNRDRTRDLPYSETVKAFIACNLELEDAMTYLMDRLEQAGILDKTLIVLTNDHYPYGLSAEEYNELAGRDIDTTFEKYRNAFLCYTTALEPVIVSDYCCTVDILPTVLNLLGVPYDSRLLAGTDVLSQAPHAAVLETHSFLTRDFRYDADTGAVIPTEPGTEIDPELLENWKLLVEQKFDLSREILNLDYYSHVFRQSGMDISLNPAANYEDLPDVFAQASAVWLVDKDYIDPDAPTFFGAARNVALGEFVDSLYRIAGRPAADPSALPPDYEAVYGDPARLELPPASAPAEAAEAAPDPGEASRPEGNSGEAGTPGGTPEAADSPGEDPVDPGPAPFLFNRDCPYYDAVCWAFDTGLLQPADHSLAPDGPTRYLDVALLLRRFCRFQGVEVLIQPRMDENGVEYDALEAMGTAFPDYSAEEIAAFLWCDQEHIISLPGDLWYVLYGAARPAKRGQAISYLFRVCSYELNLE